MKGKFDEMVLKEEVYRVKLKEFLGYLEDDFLVQVALGDSSS